VEEATGRRLERGLRLGRWGVRQGGLRGYQGRAVGPERGTYGWAQRGVGSREWAAGVPGIVGDAPTRFAETGLRALAVHEGRWRVRVVGGAGGAICRLGRAAVVDSQTGQRAGCAALQTPSPRQYAAPGHALRRNSGGVGEVARAVPNALSSSGSQSGGAIARRRGAASDLLSISPGALGPPAHHHHCGVALCYGPVADHGRSTVQEGREWHDPDRETPASGDGQLSAAQGSGVAASGVRRGTVGRWKKAINAHPSEDGRLTLFPHLLTKPPSIRKIAKRPSDFGFQKAEIFHF